MVTVTSNSPSAGLDEAEHQRIVHDWNATSTEFPNLCAHECFEQQAARTPDAIALVHAGQTLTYRELNERANQVAHYLQRCCIGPESLVGVCLTRSPAMVIGLLGVWKAGAAYVPLDPGYPPERLAFMVRDAELRLVLADAPSRPLFAPDTVGAVCLDADWAMIAHEKNSNPAPTATPDNLAYVMYTSGSTGQPKGAMIEHGGLVNYLCWAIATYRLEAGASVAVHSSIAFDLTVTSLYPPLLVGGQIELLPEDAGAGNLLAALRQGKGRSLVKITPAHLELLGQQLDPAEVARMSKTFVIGGEQLLAESLRPWRQHAPDTRLINEYGPTETVVGCSIYEVQPADPASGPVPIGRPIANTRLYVLDDARQPVPPGVTGELYIGGVGVARGYLNRPELTRERFLADPFSGDPQARLYRTGDLARYRDDGTLEYLGRTDSQIKLRGYRIEPGEIEASLAAHPGVQCCAVVAREDEPGNRQLVAYVVVRPESSPTTGDLKDFLKQRLPDYMVPAHLVFLAALPLTGNGKVDRNALPAPSPSDGVSADELVLPRTETERKLAGIWCELLKLERVGIDDDFFDLGGHSLLAIRAVSRLRDTFGVDIKIQVLFENPTIAALAAILTVAGEPPDNSLQIPPRQASGPCPLSFAQEHLWFMDQLVPGNAVYNIVDVIRLGGSYNANALHCALSELLRRHEMLRTIFPDTNGHAVQIVLPTLDVPLAELDLSALPAPAQEAEWQRAVHEQGRQAFVLSQGPLLRWVMVHLSDNEHRLLLVVHHIVADEWAMDRMHQEIRQLYAAFSLGRTSPLAALPIQYADFACWQRSWLRGAVLDKEIAYWKKKLADAPRTLELRTDKPRPAVRSFRGATEHFAVDKKLTERLKALGRQEQATLFMVLEACFMVLLRRYTGQDDLLVGTPISGRRQSETERLIGYFLNILVLRGRFTAGMSFRSLLRQVREHALEAYAHAELPFQQLVAELAPARDPGRSPLFQVMFVLHDVEGLARSSLSGHQEFNVGTAKFDLTLLFSDTENGLEGALEYSTDLFEKATIQRMCGHCVTLLDAIVGHPDESIDHLPLLTDAERHQQLVVWNDTAIDYPADVVLHQQFAAQAARRPNAVAVVFEDQSLTYRELDACTNQLAHYLQKRGVGPDSFVAVCVERSLDMVVGLLGILKAGGAYVPIDPDYPRQRMAGMLDEVQSPVVLSQRHLRERLPTDPGSVLCLDSDWPAIAGEPATPVSSPVTAQHIAYVIYTSGSTGRPKGIMIPHAAICNHLFWMQRTHPLEAADAQLQKTPFGFDPSVREFFAPLLAGARLVMARPGGHTDPAYLAETIFEQGISVLQLVPSQLRMLLDEPAFWHCAPPLRDVFCGGEPLTREMCEEFYRRLPQARLSNLYGPSETAIDATCWDCPKPAVDAIPGVIPIGRPVDNFRAYITDARLQLLPIGVPGELLIGGLGLARGYINQPELTADRFIADPFRTEPDARVYRSGDLVRYLPDGNIEFLGRLDHQVKIRGFRIELGEIESCIARHPAIGDVVVVAREDASATLRLVAYLVAEDAPADLIEQLRTLIRGALPEYMLPSGFVVLDALPLNHSGKVDRHALPEPVLEDLALAARAVGPRTPSEMQILDIFHEVLGRTDFGVLDSFFDLGGHSIMAAQLMARLQQASGLSLSLRNLFERPTVAGLAEVVDGLSWLARAKAPADDSQREEIEL